MKYIFHCEVEDLILAGGAIEAHLRDYPDIKEVIIMFGNGDTFFTRINKKSITARKINKERENHGVERK